MPRARGWRRRGGRGAWGRCVSSEWNPFGFFAERRFDDFERISQEPRNLFVRTADSPFDNNHQLLAYVAPSFTSAELATLPREQRSTFNLDLVAAGWAAMFVIYPAVPGEGAVIELP